MHIIMMRMARAACTCVGRGLGPSTEISSDGLCCLRVLFFSDRRVVVFVSELFLLLDPPSALANATSIISVTRGETRSASRHPISLFGGNIAV